MLQYLYGNCMCDNKDYGLETLLDLDGVIIDQGNGYWVKFDEVLKKQE